MSTKCCTSTHMADDLTRMRGRLHIAGSLHVDPLNIFFWIFVSECASPSFSLEPQLKINKKFKEIPSIILTFFAVLNNVIEVS